MTAPEHLDHAVERGVEAMRRAGVPPEHVLVVAWEPVEGPMYAVYASHVGFGRSTSDVVALELALRKVLEDVSQTAQSSIEGES